MAIRNSAARAPSEFLVIEHSEDQTADLGSNKRYAKKQIRRYPVPRRRDAQRRITETRPGAIGANSAEILSALRNRDV